MAGFAFLFAPIVFAHVGPTPEFAAAIAGCIRGLTAVGSWLGIAAVILTLMFFRDRPPVAAAIVGCVAIAIGAGLVETSFVVPAMERTPLLTPAYEKLHRTSGGIYSIELVAALAALIMSGLPYRSR